MSVEYKPAPILSKNSNLTSVQRFTNITRAQINDLLSKLKQDKQMPIAGLAEDQDGNLTYTDAYGTRIVVALEDRDHIIESTWKKHAYTGKHRLHSILNDRYVNISRRKLDRWANNGMNQQLHTRVIQKSVVRPQWASRYGAHVQIDLLSFEARPCSKRRFKWVLSVVDIHSRYGAGVPMMNKKSETTANHFRTLCQQWSLDKYGHIVSSDVGGEFIGHEFQDALREFNLKHVKSKPWKSTNGIVERFNQTIRAGIGKWRSATGRSDWSSVLNDIIHTYNSSVHTSIGIEPAVARHQATRPEGPDLEMQQYVNAKAFQSAKALMGNEPKPLQVGDLIRLAITAISNAARRQQKSHSHKGRKASELENWTRNLFRIKSRSKGTPLQWKQYRVYGLRGLYWRNELLGPINVSELRKDVSAKFASRSPHAGLEDSAIAELSTADELFNNNGETKAGKYSEEVKRIIGVSVEKTFSDGVFIGKVVDHIPDLDDDVTADTERWIIEYDSTGKKESIDSEELAGIMTGNVHIEEETENEETKEELPEKELGESKEEEKREVLKPKPKPKPKPKQKQNDPLLGRRVQSMDKDPKTGKMVVTALGSIIKIHKKQGKSKQYEIQWDDKQYENIKFGYARIKQMLVPVE